MDKDNKSTGCLLFHSCARLPPLSSLVHSSKQCTLVSDDIYFVDHRHLSGH